MNHDSSSLPDGDEIAITDRRSPAWGAIFAGAVAGLGTHILLMMLLTAIGMGAASPATDDNPVATFGVGTAIAWTISALISLFVGGWVAGRCAARVHSVSGTVHGFLVWCVGTIAAVLIVSSGAGALIGGAARVVGEGASAMGKPLAGAADLAKQAVEQNTGALASMLDEVAENPQVKSAPGGVAAARREIGQAVRQLFREGGNLRDPEARNATVQALTRAGVREADANRMVDSWITSMQQMRAQLEQAKEAAATKAREVAEKASKAIAKGALWGFIGFVLGAIAASLGGRRGQRWEYQHTEIGADATLDPSTRGAVTTARVARHA
ncbi:MAG TPA: hypothetical protein VM029_05550 [Opitutaceae bacterium]|nr:hypothetical protein [Opitutaceae bacterium]